MIRSKLMTDDFGSVAEPVAEVSLPRDVWSLILSLFLIGGATWLVHPVNMLPSDLFIWQPVMFIAALAFIAVWLRIWYKAGTAEVWNLLKNNLPLALVGALLFGFVGLWPQTSGSLPLTFNQIPAYFFTLGFWPLIAGPIALLRGFVLGFAISIFWNDYKTHHNDLRSVVASLGTWLAGSMAIILPSIIVTATAVLAGHSSMQATGTDLVGAFSRSNLNTYWSNAQLTRWFTGFGGELPNMMALFTASWTLLIVLCLLLVVFWRPQNIIQTIRYRIGDLWNLQLMLSAVIVGLSVGWGRMRGSSLDLVADLIFIVMLVFWYLVTRNSLTHPALSYPREGSAPSDVPQVIFLILSSALLGWPVLLPVLLGMIAVWLRPNLSSLRMTSVSSLRLAQGLVPLSHHEASLSKTVEPRGSKVNILPVILWLSLADASLAFIRGAQIISDDMVIKMLALGSIALVGIGSFYLLGKTRAWLIIAALWLIAGLFVSYVLGTFLPGALALLCVALGHIWYKIKGDFTRWMPQIIMIYLAVVLIFAFWLPRWLNPRLLPL